MDAVIFFCAIPFVSMLAIGLLDITSFLGHTRNL